MYRELILRFCILTAIATPSVTSGGENNPADGNDAKVSFSFVFSGKVGDQAGVFVKHADEREPRHLVERANWPEVSPDGRHLVFQRRMNKTFDVWSARIDGTELRQLTTDEDHDYLASWSPDGQWIIFTSWRQEPMNETRSPHLYLMRADGSEQRRIHAPSLGTSAGASWSPDGRTVIFTQKKEDGTGDLYVASIDPTKRDALGEPKRLTEDQVYDGTAVFSPDGAWIAFYSADEKRSQIEVIRPDGTDRRVIVKKGQNWYPRWSADGQWLLFVRNSSIAANDLDLYAVKLSAPDSIVPLVELPGPQNEICPLTEVSAGHSSSVGE